VRLLLFRRGELLEVDASQPAERRVGTEELPAGFLAPVVPDRADQSPRDASALVAQQEGNERRGFLRGNGLVQPTKGLVMVRPGELGASRACRVVDARRHEPRRDRVYLPLRLLESEVLHQPYDRDLRKRVRRVPRERACRAASGEEHDRGRVPGIEQRRARLDEAERRHELRAERVREGLELDAACGSDRLERTSGHDEAVKGRVEPVTRGGRQFLGGSDVPKVELQRSSAGRRQALEPSRIAARRHEPSAAAQELTSHGGADAAGCPDDYDAAISKKAH
jgi:hypothetical protein